VLGAGQRGGVDVTAARKMPAQRPGRSEQEVCSPPEFIRAVEKRFGAIKFDFAATRANAVVPHFFGPGSPIAEDALAATTNWQGRGLGYLNHPFGQTQHFVARCRRESVAFGPRRDGGAEILQLCPAAVSTDWFADHVHLKAFVVFIRPRIVFTGHATGFPKDLALFHWGPKVVPGYETWRWDS
jgi:hypothetical protein